MRAASRARGTVARSCFQSEEINLDNLGEKRTVFYQEGRRTIPRG